MIHKSNTLNIRFTFNGGVYGANLVYIPLTIRIGCNRYPPYFCAATERIVYMYTLNLQLRRQDLPQLMYRNAEVVGIPTSPPSISDGRYIAQDPYLVWRSAKLMKYIYIFMDDFITLEQRTHPITDRYTAPSSLLYT